MRMKWWWVLLLPLVLWGHWLLFSKLGSSPSIRTLLNHGGVSPQQQTPFKRIIDVPVSSQCSRAHEIWRKEYVPLHEDILAGKRPPRFLVHLPIRKGVADQLSGLITMFYVAYFTNRAFQLAAVPSIFPPFSNVFDMPNINWNAEYPKESYQRPWGLADSDSKANFLSNSNFSTLFDDTKSHVFVLSNRGRTYQIANNPFYKGKLEELGLNPLTLALCAFEFLFTPNAAVRKLQQPLLSKVSDPEALRIGVAVRTGDKVMWKQKDLNWDKYVKWLTCAQAVENTTKVKNGNENKKVVWYLITDSVEFRKIAKEKIGEKLITDMEIKPEHTTCDGRGPCAENINFTFQFAMSELLLFTKTQYQVVPGNSGFGRWGAWLSREMGDEPHIYTPSSKRKCLTPDAPSDIANGWAGI